MKLNEITTHWSDAECKQFAAGFEGDNRDEKVDDFNWKFVERFPISKIGDLPPDQWVVWMEDEIRFHDYQDYYDDMFTSDIETPVILTMHNNIGLLWDGFHRVGASLMRGKKFIPAIVGTPIII